MRYPDNDALEDAVKDKSSGKTTLFGEEPKTEKSMTILGLCNL